MTVVGRVVALRRYPVKSMAAEELDGAEVSWHGLAGDRRWAFVRDGQVRSGFPWLTIRERPEMARYRPFYTERARPNASPTLVRTPSGGELDVAAPALAAELGPGVRVIKQDRGVFDTMPLSLLTTQTLAGLGRLQGRVFRIGHLGHFNDLMLAGTLCGVEMGLKLAGVPVASSGMQNALEFLAQR